MKIRTDFVTNSSSYCTTEVIIDNPVLLEILQKYKDVGLLGDYDSIVGIGDYRSMDMNFHQSYNDRTKTPAFFYFEQQSDESSSIFMVHYIYPETMDEVLTCIISIIDAVDKYLDGQICVELKTELDKRKEEINDAYSSVYWRSFGKGDEGECECRFEFDLLKGSLFVCKDDQNLPETEVAIFNPLLLEILQKYEGMGLFGVNEEPIFVIGAYRPRFCDGWSYFEKELPDVPTFYYFEQDQVSVENFDEYLKLARFCPMKLVDVLDSIILIMENGVKYLNEKILTALREELTQRKDEINQAYSRVYWSYFNGTEREIFEYDAINGESYIKEKK